MIVSRVYRNDRKSRFGVKWGPNKKNPSFRFFETVEERESFYRGMKKQAKKQGTTILELSARDAMFLKEALDMADGNPLFVLDAVKFWQERAALKSVPVADAVQAFLDDKYNLGVSDNWMGHHRKYLERFQTYVEGVFVCDVTPEQAQAWIFQMHFSPRTLRHHKQSLRTFFNWCKARNYCRENPFENVSTPTEIQKEPEFLTVDQTRALLRVAVQNFPDALAYLSLQIFAGIRASACSRIAPEHIKFEDRLIIITAQNAKNNQRANVEGHPEALWQWLKFAKETAPEGFTLSERMHRRRNLQIAEKAGFRPPNPTSAG